MYNKKDNGLTHNFKLENGRFLLVSGGAKKQSDLRFFMAFDFVRRIYRPDFLPGLAWLIQKPLSYVDKVRTMLLGNLRNKIHTNIQNINVTSMGLATLREQKRCVVYFDYSYNDDTKRSTKEFVKVL